MHVETYEKSSKSTFSFATFLKKIVDNVLDDL